MNFKSFKATNDDQLNFSLEYLLNSPVVEGASVQATHIVFQSNKLYLSYNTRGELIRGGMEVIDFADPTDPRVSTTGIIDGEFSSLDIFTNPSTGRSYLMLAGKGWPIEGHEGAQVRMFELDNSGYPILDPQVFNLNGFTGTDINGLGIVSGTNGGLYILDEVTLGFVEWQLDLDDARSIAYDAISNQYVALLGNPGRLVTGLPNNPETYELGGIAQEGSKAILRISNGLAFVSLGEEGLMVVDINTGAIKATLAGPDVPAGENESDYVTNGVSVHNEGYLFIANGAAGVFVAKYDGAGEIEVLGSIDLDASVNYVEARGEYLFAATGTKGVAIIKMSGVYGMDPIVTTNKPSYESITKTGAVAGGLVEHNMNNEILNKGVCWSTNSTPLKSDQSSSHGPGSGSFVSQLNQLQPGTKYYLRAYATTDHGVFYGQTESFITSSDTEESDDLTDARDGREYRTIRIGNTLWMAENLAWLPSVSPVASGSLIDPFFYVYNYNGFDISEAILTSSYKTYGVLYNWNAAMTSCPDGWHLPSDEEWIELEQSLGMSAEDAAGERFRNSGEVGDKLKAEMGWNEEGNGNDVSGLGAIPAGYRVRGGQYLHQGNTASFWTADEDENMALQRGLYYFNNGVYRSSWSKTTGSSVRCVKVKN